MAKVLAEPQHRRSLARFDEMSELFMKDAASGSIIEQKLLTLYDGDTIAQGSFRNDLHIAKGIELSITGSFTFAGWLKSFAGRGSMGSGFLSRCTLSFADRVPHKGDWAMVDKDTINAALRSIAERLRSIDSGEFIAVEETADARQHRFETEEWIDSFDQRFRPRLQSHFRRDLALRGFFSREGKIDLPKAQRSRLWAEHQLAVRLALWPEDAASPQERMEGLILDSILKAKKPLSEARLATNCHARRAGSGGFLTFRRALVALSGTGQIVGVGTTQKKRVVYNLCRNVEPIPRQ
jgi:hypothetical protein